MTAEERFAGKSTTKIVLDPPAFSPSTEMRRRYLDKHLGRLQELLDSVANGDWKTVFTEANHVRGTAAMYGFPDIGTAAEELSKAIQNGDVSCRDLLEQYVQTARESYV